MAEKYTSLVHLMRRYARASSRFSRHFWRRVVARWGVACRETFWALPSPPKVFSASMMAGEWGVSHVTAKKRLLASPDFVQLSSRFFVSAHSPYLPYVCSSPSPQGFVIAVSKLRCLPADLLPTAGNLQWYLGVRGWGNVSPTGLVARLRVPTRNKYLVFVPSFVLASLRTPPEVALRSGGSGSGPEIRQGVEVLDDPNLGWCKAPNLFSVR